MIFTLILIIHVLVCLVLIVSILLQRGKGATMGAAFGTGGSQTVFGGSGAGNFLSRVTSICAAIFFSTSLILAYRSTFNRSVVDLADVPAAPTSKTGPTPGSTPAPAAAPTDGTAPAPAKDVPKGTAAPAAPTPSPIQVTIPPRPVAPPPAPGAAPAKAPPAAPAPTK
jgi:preprotein translocase subunit SecG